MEVSGVVGGFGTVDGAMYSWLAASMHGLTNLTADNVTEIIGALSAMAGSWLVASKGKWNKYGWMVYLVANAFWIVFAIVMVRPMMLLMYVSFTLSSLYGFWNYVFVDRYPELAKSILGFMKKRSA